MNLISKKSPTHSRHYSSYYYYLTNFYPFVPLLKYFLRDKMLFRRSYGQNILPFWGTSCKNMWWVNTLWCIQRLFNQVHSNTSSVFGGCYCKPWLHALVVYFVLPFLVETFTWQCCWYDRQSRPEIPQKDRQLPRRRMTCTANFSWACKTEACSNTFVCTMNNVLSNLKGYSTIYIYNTRAYLSWELQCVKTATL